MALDPIRVHESAQDTARQRERFRLPIFSRLRRQRIEALLELLKTHSSANNRRGVLHIISSITQ
jgi:hypothetical protein